ncbi:MmpS family protein [Actinomycetospora endophytica]|uniref:MmpS family protein n=1 Tax=Actinomycetospora endophytica TaxID=2291215 RepID=A0ABS8PJ02_9PSEU|nr:MmpS family transport accessory protein [Actinomycetospora endophytica]MCD2198258.1 MmpS family protein [Actinomycetospora endophytica]
MSVTPQAPDAPDRDTDATRGVYVPRQQGAGNVPPWTPQPPQGQGQQPPKRPTRWPFIVMGIAVVIALIALTVHGAQTTTSAATTPAYTAPSAPAYTAPAAPQYSPPSYSAPTYQAPSSDSSSTGSSSGSTTTGPSTYTYKITGPSRAMITYTKANLQIAQESSAKVPWTKTVDKSGGSFSVASLTAQNSGSGTISCSITDDETGAVIASNSSEGPYAVVTCSGS